MTKRNDPRRSTVVTVAAAQKFSRRLMLQRSLAAGALAAGPWYVKDAFSSSGQLNILNWDDELPNPVIPDFTKKTGIAVNKTPFSQNEEQINKLQATGGEGFDLCQPTRDRAPQFKDIGVLAPFDMNKLPTNSALLPSMMEASTSLWTWDGGLYHLPHCWGSEALSWRTDKWQPKDPLQLSFGDLWGDEVKGHVQGRPHSMLLGIGLWMDGSGKLPTNRMLDAFKDPDTFRKIYDVILPFAI